MEYCTGKSGGLSGKGYSGSGSVGMEGDQMSLEELLAVDFRDSASLKASRRKRMARQRRPVGSYCALPGPFLPSVAPPCPPPIPPVRIAFLLLSSSKSDALLSRTFEVMDTGVCYI